VLAAGKLAGATFLGTAADSMRIAATTFIIPFAFVFSPELMSFPSMSWAVLPPLLEVLAIQYTASIAGYGHYLRPLGGTERWMFAGIAVTGFFNMTLGDMIYLVVGVAWFAAMTIYILVSKKRS